MITPGDRVTHRWLNTMLATVAGVIAIVHTYSNNRVVVVRSVTCEVPRVQTRSVTASGHGLTTPSP